MKLKILALVLNVFPAHSIPSKSATPTSLLRENGQESSRTHLFHPTKLTLSKGIPREIIDRCGVAETDGDWIELGEAERMLNSGLSSLDNQNRFQSTRERRKLPHGEYDNSASDREHNPLRPTGRQVHLNGDEPSHSTAQSSRLNSCGCVMDAIGFFHSEFIRFFKAISLKLRRGKFFVEIENHVRIIATGERCSICQMKFKESEIKNTSGECNWIWIYSCYHCHNPFHRDCLDRWLAADQGVACPLCRYPIKTKFEGVVASSLGRGAAFLLLSRHDATLLMPRRSSVLTGQAASSNLDQSYRLLTRSGDGPRIRFSGRIPT